MNMKRLNLSDGSIYEGQVEECLISGKQILVLIEKVSILFKPKLAIFIRVSSRTIRPMARVYLPRQPVSVIKVGLRMANSMERAI